MGTLIVIIVAIIFFSKPILELWRSINKLWMDLKQGKELISNIVKGNDETSYDFPNNLGGEEEIEKMLGNFISQDNSDTINVEKAYQLKEEGDFVDALDIVNKGLKVSPHNREYLFVKGEILYYSGDSTGAINTITDYIRIYPNNYEGYYRRGWFYNNTGNYQLALKDLTKAISINPSFSYNYLYRGDAFRMLDNKDAAMVDYELAIQFNNEMNSIAPSAFAYLYLGKKEECLEWVDRVLQQNNDNSSNYDAACIYSIIGNKEQALYYFEQALIKGFKSLGHIEKDKDLDNIRELPEFEVIINNYLKKPDDQNISLSDNNIIANETVTGKFEEHTKSCLNCGNMINEDNLFCPYCGSPQAIDGEIEEGMSRMEDK